MCHHEHLTPPHFQRYLARLAARAVAAGLLALLPAAAQAQSPPPQLVAPVVRTHVDATYPESAHRENKHGDVVLAVTVDVHGHVSAVEVLESAGADLDQAAIVAARQWTFDPALRNGKPVAAKIRVPFHFSPPAAAVEVVEAPAPASQASSHAHSHEEPKAAAKASDEVLVHGRPMPPSRGASDFNLRIGELARVYRGNAAELLKLAPGILLSNEGGEGHAQQVFLRGFDAREGQDIEFTVDGVPINEPGNIHGGGFAETNFIIPELVESLRVVEGPFDPRQGNFAVAGSADYQLGLQKRGTTIGYRGGSFNTHRLLLLWGPKDESVHTFGGAELYRTDGFGQNRGADRATGMGQYEGRIGERGSYRLTTQAYTTKYFSAGVLRQDDLRAGRVDFYDTYDPRQGGSSSRYSLAADIVSRGQDTTYTQQLFLIRRDLRLLKNFTGFLEDTQEAIQSPHGQRGDLIDLNNGVWTMGGRGASRIAGSALGHKQELEVGYFARGDLVDSSEQRLEATTSVPYKTETLLSSKLGNIGLYGDANLHATRWLTVRGGLRAELFSFDAQNLCAAQDVSKPSVKNPPGDASCLTQSRFGVHREANQRASTVGTALLPRASVLLGPFDHFTFSAAYGQGARSIDPVYVTQDVRTPYASITSYEGGVGYARDSETSSLVVKSIFFQTHVDRDLIFNQTAGRSTLANGTSRTGWAGTVRYTGMWLDQAASLTLVRSSFDDTNLLVPYVPDLVFRSDTALHADLPVRIRGDKLRGALGSGITYVGRRELPFSERSQRILTVDASATLGLGNVELGVIASNLLDNRYRLSEYNYSSVFQQGGPPTLVASRHFVAGAPRAVFGTLTMTLGGS